MASSEGGYFMGVSDSSHLDLKNINSSLMQATSPQKNKTIFNFSAGPGVLPRKVLERVQQEMLDYSETGSSLVEISHRSKEFLTCIREAEADMRKLLQIPENYAVLFLQGGASTQFSAVVYNLLTDVSEPVDYIVSGGWSDKAAQEAARLGARVNVVFTSKQSKHNGEKLTAPEEFNWSIKKEGTKPAYIYYCANETVHGVEMPNDWVNKLQEVGGGGGSEVPIVCDMSSNFMSRPFDVSKFGVIFAGAQKNVGPAGLTVVIVRKDLLGRFEKCPIKGPLMLDYKTCADNEKEVKGLASMGEINELKSRKLYEVLGKYPNVYSIHVVNEGFRSRMNVTFRILKDGKASEEREKEFIKEAEALGCRSLAGHRSVGGMRASLYNALSMEAVDTLVTLLDDFAKRS